MHYIEFIIGDWSDEGHGKTESFFAISSATQKELHKIYKKAVKEYGIDPEGLCDVYEVSTIPADDFKRIKDQFSEIVEKLYDTEDDDGSQAVDPEFFVNIICAMINRYVDDDEFIKRVECFRFPVTVGYGLFQ